jgi:hypothetical protein
MMEKVLYLILPPPKVLGPGRRCQIRASCKQQDGWHVRILNTEKGGIKYELWTTDVMYTSRNSSECSFERNNKTTS